MLRHAASEYYSSFSAAPVRRRARPRYARTAASDGTRVSAAIGTTAAGTHTLLAYLASPGGLSATYYASHALDPAAATSAAASLGGTLDWSAAAPGAAGGDLPPPPPLVLSGHAASLTPY